MKYSIVLNYPVPATRYRDEIDVSEGEVCVHQGVI